MALAAVFLDLGNTLLTERPARAAIYAEEARRAGLGTSEAEMAGHMTRALAALPRDLAGAFRYSDAWFGEFHRRLFVLELGLAATDLAPLSARLFARFQDARTFVLYPGARELLGELRGRGLKLGLISNWSERLPALLAALGWSSAFDFVLGSAALRMEKPEGGIFRLALARAGVEPERCLHAGDDLERDAHGALGAGLAAVLVDHQGRLGEVEAPCPVVGSLAELRDLILERCA